MPQQDDATIPNNVTLIRAVRPDWVITEDGRERLTSATFKDGQLEASCFIAEEVGGLDGFKETILPELERQFGFTPRIATIDVATVRSTNLWAYRKPEEFCNNPAHVVICPSENMSKSTYGKRAGDLARSAQLCEADVPTAEESSAS